MNGYCYNAVNISCGEKGDMESPKVEYTDLYRFGASLGVILIGVAIFGPWVILRNDYGLILDSSTYASLQPQAQLLFDHKVKIFNDAQTSIFWIASVIFVLGAFILYKSVRNWFIKKQVHEDKKYEIESASFEEKQAARLQEIQEQKVDISTKLEPTTTNDSKRLISEISSLDMLVSGKLGRCFSEHFQVLSNLKIGSAYYDFILQARDKSTKDIIIELKTLQTFKTDDWLIKLLSNLTVTKDLYNLTQGNASRAILLIVKFESDKGQSYIARLESFAKSFNELSVKVIDRDVLQITDCSEFRKLILDE